MDVFIWEVRFYTCIVINFFFIFICIIQNIHLILYKYLFNFKRKVKNKVHVEVSICEVYIIEEISKFISYHFLLILTIHDCTSCTRFIN